MATLCGTCGDPVPVRDRGRPARYCSAACKAKAYRRRKNATAAAAAAPSPVHAAPATTIDMPGTDASAADLAARLAEVAAHLAVAIDGGRAGDLRPDGTAELLGHAQRTLDALGALVRTSAAAPAPAPVSRDEILVSVTEIGAGPGRDEIGAAVTESRPLPDPEEPDQGAAEREAQDEGEDEGGREEREFVRRLRPVPELGEGYRMAEWPGTGRYHLVYEGERIGHAAKKTFTSRWQAHSAHGPKISATGTYATRRQALAEVALHHRELRRAQPRTRKRR